MEVIPKLLLQTAETFPDHRIGYIQPDRTIRYQTYPDLLKQAGNILYALHKMNFYPGEKAILSLQGNQEIIPALWACFLGGIIPVLLQPPVSFTTTNPAAEKAGKVFRILENPRVILSARFYETWIKSGIPDSHLIQIPAGEEHENTPFLPDISPDDLALIQFSSGSTGDPKGVMLTHRQILSNIRDIIYGIRLTSDDVSVSWLPLYHDMGLIGFNITPTQVGCPQYFIEPIDFVKNPLLWLDSISEHQAAITSCPNFGQGLVIRALKRREAATWDLRSLRVIFNAAEPISVPVMRAFQHNLTGFGLKPEAMFPAYGLAEASLAVTFAPLENPPETVRFQRMPLLQNGQVITAPPDEPDALELVNLGMPLPQCIVEIRQEDGEPLPENHVGSVWVAGPNVSFGYINNPDATAGTFSQGWLNTGDMGFIHQGNLFITGRKKDVIFINGINYYANDLETLCLEEGLDPGKIIVAGYFDEEEGKDQVLVFMVGFPVEQIPEVSQTIKSRLLHSLGLNVNRFIAIRQADVPRTSSGKIQRYILVNRFLRGDWNQKT